MVSEELLDFIDLDMMLPRQLFDDFVEPDETINSQGPILRHVAGACPANVSAILSQLSATLSQLPATLSQLPATLSQLPATLTQLPATLTQPSATLSQLSATLSQLSATLSQFSQVYFSRERAASE